MVTTQQVVDALARWRQANAIAVDAANLPTVPQEELRRLWNIEEAALEAYTSVYNAFHTQGATPDDNA